MNITRKPIRKCNGCQLNFRKYCGLYETPRLMWDKGKCPGFNSEEAMARYKATIAEPIESKEKARRKRKEIQELRKTEGHHSGSMYTMVSSDVPQGRKKAATFHSNYVSTGKRTAKMSRSRAGLQRKRPQKFAAKKFR